MNAFVDLDGVLLDTARFVRNFKALLISLGIPAASVDRYFASVIEGARQYRSRTYYLIANRQNIGQIMGHPEVSNTAEVMDCFLTLLKDYLFPDAIDFLESLPTKNVFMVTYGGRQLQELKIEKTCLRPYFRDIAITHGGLKTDAIISLRDGGLIDEISGVFIDDSGSEISRMKARFPQIYSILVHRPGGKHNEEPCFGQDVTVCDLVEAGSIIKQLQQKET